ncbi:MAG: diguanylate cyclase [bacterium]|nr:diguanylate cyclase [bacterium]
MTSGRQKPRILYVDDEADLLLLYRELLSDDYDVVTTHDPQHALELLDREDEVPFSVIVSDLRMPQMDGIDFLARCRFIAPQAARLLLTGHADFDVAVNAINQGYVFRFLTKPCPQEVLEEALRAALAHHDEGQAKQLHDLVYRDDLTQLYNRRYFDTLLPKEHARCERHSRSYSLVFIDMDGLKAVNTEHGHIAGGRVIAQTGMLIADNTRESNFAFRFGGDEFVILVVEADRDSAEKTAHRVVDAIARHRYDIGAGEKISLSASAGIACYPRDGRTPEQMLKSADEAMYRAKATDEDAVVCFS